MTLDQIVERLREFLDSDAEYLKVNPPEAVTILTFLVELRRLLKREP